MIKGFVSDIRLHLRDRPFNLQGGGYGFFVRSEKKFRTGELEYLFFCRAKRKFFFQNLTLSYDKNSESDYFFFRPPKSEYFFRKKPYPPSLQVKWSFPKS